MIVEAISIVVEEAMVVVAVLAEVFRSDGSATTDDSRRGNSSSP